MNYTTNYHLPQWVETDRIQMEDFNDAMAAMDQGMAEAKVAAEAAQEAAGTAQAAAEIAQSSADAVADAYTPDNKPCVVGTYTGNGGEMAVTLGFRPSFVIINGLQNSYDAMGMEEFAKYSGITAGPTMSRRVQFTDTGFLMKPSDPDNYYYPNFTESGRKYDYIAFR